VKDKEGAEAEPLGKEVIVAGVNEVAVSTPVTSTPVSVIRRRLVPRFEKAIAVVVGFVISR